MRDRLVVVLAVAGGGAIGALARWALFRFSDSMAGVTWWATLAVNAVGCLAMGLVVGALDRRGGGSAAMRAFVTTGILGGFTTFSAFAVDAVRLGQDAWWSAVVYAVATMVMSIGLVLAGLRLMRRPR